MVAKVPIINRQDVTKSRQKSINTLGIDQYRRRPAQKQKRIPSKEKSNKKSKKQARKSIEAFKSISSKTQYEINKKSRKQPRKSIEASKSINPKN